METRARPAALEMNPYSSRFDPAKYFAYTEKPKHTTTLIIAEDNEAVIKIVHKARSMALRHLPRTHTIDVRWLFEVCSQPRVRMTYTNTKQQIADLMTKAITQPATWAHLLDIAQIRPGPLIGSTVTTKPAAISDKRRNPRGSWAPAPETPNKTVALVRKKDQCSTCGFLNFLTSKRQCPCGWD